jgi:hypothetical protein
LRTSDGLWFISHIHHCFGTGEYQSRRPRPRDMADFLESYGTVYGWKRLEVSRRT